MSPRRATFDGTSAIVTGAASGIGLALSEELLAQGARVMMADINEEQLAAESERLREMGTVAHAAVDVADPDAVTALVERAREELGGIDYLFNNAGVNVVGEARHHTFEDWARILDVNLRGVVHGIRAVYPIMIDQGHGHIVNIASTAALVPAPFQVAYATSKHAVLGLSVSLRAEAKKYGVKVSVVCPGFIATNLGRAQKLRGITQEGLENAIPRRKYPAERCARDTLRGVAKNKELIYITRLPRWLHRARRWFPSLASAVAARIARKGLEAPSS